MRDISDGLREYSTAVGVLSSAFHVRVQITQLLCLFRDNVQYAWPSPYRSHKFVESLSNESRKDAAELSLEAASDCERFPVHFKKLARELKQFIQNLDSVSEFADAVELKRVIYDFWVDLEVSSHGNSLNDLD